MSHQQDNESVDRNILARLERLEARRDEARWWRRATLALLALAVSAPFVVDALGPVPNSFASGDVISASEMNENFAYLQEAISGVEAKLPANACTAGQISRFDGTNWVCSDEAELTSSNANLAISNGVISLNADLDVTTVAATGVDFRTNLTWNNSAANGTPEMTVIGNSQSCDATLRGRVRIIRQEDIGNSMDLGDSLCFCQEYVDRTPEPDAAPVYRWVCIYPQSDGD